MGDPPGASQPQSRRQPHSQHGKADHIPRRNEAGRFLIDMACMSPYPSKLER